MARPESWDTRVLVHAPIGRDGPACAQLLRRFQLEVEVCASIGDLLDRANEGVGAFCVTEEGLFGPHLLTIGAWVAAQPAWSDVPFVVLTSRLSQPAVVQWRERMVIALRNVTLLERPVQSITLTTTVQSTIRARKRQYETRRLLLQQERAAALLEEAVKTRTHELEVTNAELRAQMQQRAIVEESLRHAQKMEAVGQLTGGVAHDFNNLLMVISGGLQIFERQQDPARRERLVQVMHQAIERGAGLTRQLLAFSRRQPVHSKPIDPITQIMGMREMLERSLSGDIEVVFELAAQAWVVEVDPGEFELVLLNLAVNARDAMPAGGTITIRAENLQGVDHPDMHGDFVAISVIDTGTGMSEEIRSHIFEPFFTTKDVGKGSGLGLAQVYGFAKQSGGKVEVFSELGAGTTVRLLLPRSLKASTDVAEVDEKVDASAGSNAHILLVEDDDEVAAMVTGMIEELGFRATRVDGPGAALALLAGSANIDAVLSDIMMPGGMSGTQLAREMRARHMTVPIVLTSGYLGQEARSAQADGFALLPKPFSIQELAAILATALEGCRSA
jgi:signal transduction histidine kinase/ActR/RegA family two-component response regulator